MKVVWLYSKKSKAQAIMIDFFFAIIILVFLIELYFSGWGRSVLGIGLKEQKNEMEILALQITDMFVKSPGVPSDWNQTNVLAIGLAQEDHILDTDKVNKFTNLSVDKTKQLLGISDLNFYFKLDYVQGDNIKEYGSVPVNSEEIVLIRRLVFYEEKKAFMEMYLWK